MDIEIESLLHARILKHCKQLYIDGHHKHSAHEAMIQVELAIKEKLESAGTKNNGYGVFLITNLFGKDRLGIKLRIPLGDDLQSDAEILFKGAFKYYRNYCAHDGSQINSTICLRILILASELLDLIGISYLSFEDVGGVNGLVKVGAFKDKSELLDLLDFLNGYTIEDDTCDGFYETFYEKGFAESQLTAVIELDLIVYCTKAYDSSLDFKNEPYPPEEISWFELTDLGKKFVSEAKKVV